MMAVTLLTSVATAWASGDITPEQSLQRLKEGNARYMKGTSAHPRFDSVTREKTARQGQKPIATILGCSDARVPPEVIFDQGFGDLFVARVAGNVCATAELATIEYGVKYLNTPLLVVLGHTRCGAVEGALNEAKLSGTIPQLLALILPAVREAKAAHPDLKERALSDAAVEANVKHSMSEILKNSPGLATRIKEHKLKMVGAVRDIEHGGVRWIDDAK